MGETVLFKLDVVIINSGLITSLINGVSVSVLH